ncbi:CHAP domain-containing protein [Paraburkholderia sp.]|uniref:CHAP domain-containing protein n=1 Tax=Paraburkholderia sp. TaxID=1926495 RepID=UPI003D6FC2DE
MTTIDSCILASDFLYRGTRMPNWNIYAAVAHLRDNAEAGSTANCAKYVRRAIEAGGITLTHTASARNYGGPLTAAGFHEVLSGAPWKGDVVVIQPITGHPDGHMAMYDGQIWISDFKQYHGFYPSQAYRNIHPPYKIYRRN